MPWHLVVLFLFVLSAFAGCLSSDSPDGSEIQLDVAVGDVLTYRFMPVDVWVEEGGGMDVLLILRILEGPGDLVKVQYELEYDHESWNTSWWAHYAPDGTLVHLETPCHPRAPRQSGIEYGDCNPDHGGTSGPHAFESILFGLGLLNGLSIEAGHTGASLAMGGVVLPVEFVVEEVKDHWTITVTPPYRGNQYPGTVANVDQTPYSCSPLRGVVVYDPDLRLPVRCVVDWPEDKDPVPSMEEFAFEFIGWELVDVHRPEDRIPVTLQGPQEPASGWVERPSGVLDAAPDEAAVPWGYQDAMERAADLDDGIQRILEGPHVLSRAILFPVEWRQVGDCDLGCATVAVDWSWDVTVHSEAGGMTFFILREEILCGSYTYELEQLSPHPAVAKLPTWSMPHATWDRWWQNSTERVGFQPYGIAYQAMRHGPGGDFLLPAAHTLHYFDYQEPTGPDGVLRMTSPMLAMWPDGTVFSNLTNGALPPPWAEGDACGLL